MTTRGRMAGIRKGDYRGVRGDQAPERPDCLPPEDAAL